MHHVADNVYKLGSSLHNFYLLVDGSEATLIDSGCSKEWGQLTDSLAALRLSLDAVSGVLITHSHVDHFGLAKKAQDHGIDVRVHTDEETRALGTYTGKYAVKPMELPIWSIRTWRNFIPMIRAGGMSLDHVDTVATFSDGEQLDLPGGLTAVHTPGHTEGHTMFHAEGLGILFSGDGLITMDLLGDSTGPQMIERRFNNDHDAAWSSLDRIEHLDADLLLPGHGPSWSTSPADAVRTARTLVDRAT